MMDLLAFCRKEIPLYITDVPRWKANVKNLVVEFEDEIPLWVGIRKGKRAVDRSENVAANNAQKRRRLINNTQAA